MRQWGSNVQDDLARIAIGLPVASLWPLAVPYLARSRGRTGAVAGISALYILAPQIPSALSLLLLGITAAIPIAFWPSDKGNVETSGASWRHRLSVYSPIIAAFLLGLLTAVLLDAGSTKDALGKLVGSDHIAIASTGLIAAVFLGGSVVAWLLTPFTLALEKNGETSRLPGLANAGRYIGWFERAVLFAFVIGGEPEAAAVALAAKSFARFPTLSDHHEGFAEYFLIGSLSSLTVATAAAAATRAALGIGPF